MHLTAVQYDIAWEDKPANHAIVDAMLDDAGPPAGGLIVLPEMGDTGFSFNLDRVVDAGGDDLTGRWAAGLASRHASFVLAGDVRLGRNGRGRNRVRLFAPNGDVDGAYEKLHPFSFGREAEFFDGGESLLVTRLGGDRDANAPVIAPLICYDLRFPEVFRLAAHRGAEILTCGANWPDTRQHHWRSLLIARAIENQACVIGVNRIGRDPGLSYAGGSIIVGPKGDILAEAGDSAAVLRAELDLSALRSWRAAFPALSDIRPELIGDLPASPSGSGSGTA